MRNVYRGLAYLIAGLVVVQAASMAWAIFGLTNWIEAGGTLDKAAFETPGVQVGGFEGIITHVYVGMFAIPIAALLLLVSSFFARIPGGVKFAVALFLSIVVQILVAGFAHGLPGLGLIHGGFALVICALAAVAGLRVPRAIAARDAKRASAPAGAPVAG